MLSQLEKPDLTHYSKKLISGISARALGFEIAR